MHFSARGGPDISTWLPIFFIFLKKRFPHTWYSTGIFLTDLGEGIIHSRFILRPRSHSNFTNTAAASDDQSLKAAVGGSGHQMPTNMLWMCGGMCRGLPFGLIRLARPRILYGPKPFFLPWNCTNVCETNHSVPFGLTRSNRVKTRPDAALFSPHYPDPALCENAHWSSAHP